MLQVGSGEEFSKRVGRETAKENTKFLWLNTPISWCRSKKVLRKNDALKEIYLSVFWYFPLKLFFIIPGTPFEISNVQCNIPRRWSIWRIQLEGDIVVICVTGKIWATANEVRMIQVIISCKTQGAMGWGSRKITVIFIIMTIDIEIESNFLMGWGNFYYFYFL